MNQTDWQPGTIARHETFARTKARGRATRRGLSLLEVIIALAVLTGTAAILAEMVSLGARHAERSRQITEAQTIAHNILNELMSDLRSWEASEAPQPVDPWSPWDYQLSVEPVGLGDLVAVTITVVERTDPDQEPAAPAESLDQTQVTNPRHFHLTRWLRHTSELNDPAAGTTEPARPTLGDL